MTDTVRKPFAIWKIGEEEYKLKLTTAEIIRLEGMYKTNLMNLVTLADNSVPALRTMLDITHGALQKFHHGISMADTQEMFDDYFDAGGDQTKFMTDVLIPIYQVSGFFSQSEAEKKPARRKTKATEQ